MAYLRPFIVWPLLPGATLVLTAAEPDEYRIGRALTEPASGTAVVAFPARPEAGRGGGAIGGAIGVFRDGLLAESGTEAELIASGGIYARLRRNWETGASA
ncbi:hypothetical protein [Nocardiopsis potens]|uniref:hypothetical protein n=1 Tax=Nocardiopsis potens TaxID=1246458 RepID=UPI00034CAF4E|nr:hypothetical protein [Nocardiopsis potens]